MTWDSATGYSFPAACSPSRFTRQSTEQVEYGREANINQFVSSGWGRGNLFLLCKSPEAPPNNLSLDKEKSGSIELARDVSTRCS